MSSPINALQAGLADVMASGHFSPEWCAAQAQAIAGAERHLLAALREVHHWKRLAEGLRPGPCPDCAGRGFIGGDQRDTAPCRGCGGAGAPRESRPGFMGTARGGP